MMLTNRPMNGYPCVTRNYYMRRHSIGFIILCWMSFSEGIVTRVDIINTRSSFVLAFDIPPLLQDPQTMPRNPSYFFGVDRGAVLELSVHIRKSDFHPEPPSDDTLLQQTYIKNSIINRYNLPMEKPSSNTNNTNIDLHHSFTDASIDQTDITDSYDRFISKIQSSIHSAVHHLIPLNFAIRLAGRLGLLMILPFKRLVIATLGENVISKIGITNPYRDDTSDIDNKRYVLAYNLDSLRTDYPVDNQLDTLALLRQQNGARQTNRLVFTSCDTQASMVESTNNNDKRVSSPNYVGTDTAVMGDNRSIHNSAIQYNGIGGSSPNSSKSLRANCLSIITSMNNERVLSDIPIRSTSTITKDTERLKQELPTGDDDPTDMYLFAMTFDQFQRSRLVWGSSINAAANSMISYLKVPLKTDTSFRHEFRITDQMLIFITNNRHTLVDITGNISLINPGGMHMSTNQMYEASSALFIAVVYSIILIGVLIVAIVNWNIAGQTPLHIVMLSFLTTKVVYVLIDWLNATAFNRLGEVSDWRWIIPRLLCKVGNIIFLILFLLLGLGWRVFRDSLTQLEIRLCAALCLMSLYLSIFEISMGGFEVSRYMTHAMTCLVIVAVSFDITILTAQISEMNLSISTGERYRKLNAYCLFRWIVIIFITRPTMLLIYKLTVLGHDGHNPKDTRFDWMVLLLDNLLEMGMILGLIYAFRPVQPLRVFKALRLQTTTEDINRPVDNDDTMSSDETYYSARAS